MRVREGTRPVEEAIQVEENASVAVTEANAEQAQT